LRIDFLPDSVINNAAGMEGRKVQKEEEIKKKKRVKNGRETITEKKRGIM